MSFHSWMLVQVSSSTLTPGSGLSLISSSSYCAISSCAGVVSELMVDFTLTMRLFCGALIAAVVELERGLIIVACTKGKGQQGYDSDL